MMTKDGLAEIPVIDVCDGGPVRQAVEGRARALALRDDCLSFLPPTARRGLPLMDRLTRRWLRRSRSPYVTEIEGIASALGFPGIWFLNGCYQWGCTTLAREQDGAPWLIRTLDWPFPGLGRHIEIAAMQGPAGTFESVTWPGYAGMLTGCARGRFAATINQAPVRRRTRQPWLRPVDFTLNAIGTWGIRHVPPDHLLREVFEQCGSYAEAKHRLETTPLARPVIYTLAGCRPGERCVIERTEEGFASRSDQTSAANDWLQARPGWEARMPADVMFTRSYAEAAARSRARSEQVAACQGRFATGSFGWVVPPVLNTYTRLAVEMCAATGVLRAVGYEQVPGTELPQPVTRVRELAPALA
jgi:hypothetical protein